MSYVIRFYNEAADAYRFFVKHQNSQWRYNITSTEKLSEAKVFDELGEAEDTAYVMKDEMRCEVNVYEYNPRELFKLVLAGK